MFLYLAFEAIHGPLQKPPVQHSSPHNEQMKWRRFIVDDMIHALDTAVGHVSSALEETGLMENTLLVFTSDNGGAIGTWADNSPLRGGKFTQWEGGTRVPTFVNGPMVRDPGRVFGDLFHAVDWMPTILGAVDAQSNTERVVRTDGLNLWDSLVENRPGIKREEIIYVLDEIDGTYVYRRGDHKLIVGRPDCSEYGRQIDEKGVPILTVGTLVLALGKTKRAVTNNNNSCCLMS